MSVDLKPCPFCGSDAVHLDSEVWGADCRNCGACGPEPTNVSAGSTLWNTRTPDPAVAVLEAEVARLREALIEMVDEKCDYMRINRLGDPETQHSIKRAREVMNPAPSEKEAG